MHVRPHAGPPDLGHLLRGHEVRCWVTRELERLQVMCAPAGARPSLADGGVLVAGAISQLSGSQRERVAGAIFLDP